MFNGLKLMCNIFDSGNLVTSGEIFALNARDCSHSLTKTNVIASVDSELHDFDINPQHTHQRFPYEPN